MNEMSKGAMKPHTIKLHEMLIRMAKGMLSAWEDWLKEARQNS